MQQEFLQVTISAETTEQADLIMNRLLEKRLATGGQIVSAPARFWWEGGVVDTDYFTITTYTTVARKDAIIAEVTEVSTEAVPMISFVPMDGSQAFLEWIEDTLED